MDRIISEEQYQETLARIEVFLKRGSKNMTFEEKELLLQISVLAEAYEQEVCPMPMQPQSLLGMIQVKMFERRLKQKELASLLEISETTLSDERFLG